MTGGALRAARHSLFLGLRCSGPFSSASVDIPPCRLAHSASTAQRLLVASAHPVADAGGYADRAAARKAARKQDTPRPTLQQHVPKTRNKGAVPAPGHTAKGVAREAVPNGVDQRVSAVANREKTGPGEQQPGFVSMSDSFLAEMAALLEEPAGTQASSVTPAPSAAQQSSSAAQRSSKPAPTAPAQHKAPADARQERPPPSAAAAGIPRRKGGEVASESARESNNTWARDRFASGSSWGQVSDDRPSGSQRRAAGLPHSSTAPQDSLDWDNLGRDAAATGNGRLRAAGSSWDNQGKRHLRDDASSSRQDDAPSWNGAPRGRGGGGQRGREGPPARRPLRLTHRERVKLCLESNRRITDALEAVQDELAREGASAAEQRGSLCGFVTHLERIVDEGGDHFDPVNISTAMHALGSTVGDPDLSSDARSGVAYQTVAERLIRLAERECSAFKMPAVMMLFWALVRLDAPVSEAFLDGMAARATARLRELPLPEPQYVSGILWAFSRIRAGQPLSPAQVAMVDAVFAVAPKVLPDASFQNIANLAYALAILNHRAPPELLTKIAEAALLRMPSATSHGVSNLLWAYAKLGLNPLGGQLFRNAVAHACSNLDKFSMQHLTNTLWSLAVVQHEAKPEVLDSFAEALIGRMGQATPQHFGNAAWAMAKLGYSPLNGRFMDTLIKQAFPLRTRFHRQELSNMLWALATLQHELPEAVLHDVSEEFVRLALCQLSTPEAGRERHLANMAWSCARLRVNPCDGALLDAVCAELVANPNAFSVQNMANIVLSAGILQHPVPQPVVDLVVSELQARSVGSVLPHQEACNVLWGLATLDQLNRSHLEQLVARLTAAGVAEKLSKAEAMQLRQADLVVRANEQRSGLTGSSCLPLELQHLAEHDKIIVTSRFQKDVSETLQELGIAHSVEAEISHATLGPATVDILIERPGQPPMALEVDGPSHFMAVPPYRNLGHTALRNRLLKDRGVDVVQLPFHDGERRWTDVQGDMETQMHYVSRTLTAHSP
ncbi:probable RAP domain-containing protein, chloroplastic at C-terminar half [Coccomyxa sp. Obi]|nr:probable RAP domain-containing protein, chloroplastic at C-terminar half [Coccomyxa sp. Obi]